MASIMMSAGGMAVAAKVSDLTATQRTQLGDLGSPHFA